jgi:hypothetical protein
MKADTEAIVLNVLAAGPLQSGEIGTRSHLTTGGVLGVLHRLSAAKLVRRWGARQQTRWALAGWRPGPGGLAVLPPADTQRTISFQPKPEPATESWWIDVPREGWTRAIRGQVNRMQGSKIGQWAPTTKETC